MTRPPTRLTRPPIAASSIGVVISMAEEMTLSIMRAPAFPEEQPSCATAKTITVPCSIWTISIGTSLNSWIVGSRGGQSAEQDRGEEDADRRIAAEQRDGDAGEAVARREAGDEAVDDAERMDAAGEPADRAGEDHRRDDQARHVDADGAAEARVEAGEACLEADDGIAAPTTHRRRAAERDQEAEVEGRGRQQPGQLGRRDDRRVAELAEPGASSGPLTR